MFKRYKAAKRVLALLLCGCLVFGSVYQTRQKAYAGAAGLIAGGAVAGGLAFAYLMGMMGVTAPTPDPYQSSDALSAWASEQAASYKAWCKELHEANQDAWHPEELDAEFNAWCTKLGQGVLDKSSAIWTDFKSWIASKVYVSKVADISENVAVGSNIHFRTLYGPQGSDDRFYAEYTVDNCSSDALQAVCTYIYNSNCYIMFVTNSNTDFVNLRIHRTLESTGEDWENRVLLQVKSRGKFAWSRTSYVSYSVKDSAYFPNFIGAFSSSDYSSISDIDEIAFQRGQEIAKAGYVAGTVDYGFTGALSDVYNKSTVDDLDIVGGVDAPTRAGELAIPIAWPVDEDKLVDWLGRLKDGTITWSDAVARVGAAAIDVATDVPYVIGNEGVTTKEYTYAQDKADEKEDEIDIPAEGTKPSTALGSYTLAGLEKLFPFCLPFDLMDFIGVLDATPQAPNFTIPFKYPTRGGTETYDIVIDLSSFDSVAELLRDMECLAFIVGLIMITRSRMIRG